MEEQEIDLRPYILPLVARWKLIILITLGVALLFGLKTYLTPPVHSATSSVLIRSQQSRPNFDPRFPNQNISANASDQGRQKALTELATSSLLEEQVLPLLPAEALPDDYQSGDIANRFKVDVEGELIRITTKDEDPELAHTVVNIWTQTYVSQVNTIYSGIVLDQVEEELTAAQERYDKAQQTLENFVLTNDLTPLNRQIEILNTLLAHSRSSTLEQFSTFLGRARGKQEYLLSLKETQRRLQAGQTGNLSNILLALNMRPSGSAPFQLQLDSLDVLDKDRITSADIDVLIGLAEQERDDLVEQHHQLARDSISGDVETIALPLELRDAYEQQVRELQMQVEQQNAQQMLLTQNRDIALSTLSTLKTKLDEQRVSQGFTENQLVFIGTTIETPRLVPIMIKQTAIGLVVGLFLGVGWVLVYYVIRPGFAKLYTEAQQGT